LWALISTVDDMTFVVNKLYTRYGMV